MYKNSLHLYFLRFPTNQPSGLEVQGKSCMHHLFTMLPINDDDDKLVNEKRKLPCDVTCSVTVREGRSGAQFI